MSALRKFATAALLATACSVAATTSAQAAKICFAFQDLETEFWVAGHKAITTTLTKGGHEVLERNANEDANKQLEQVKDCITQNVDGIIIIPQDGESATTIVKEAQAADIPVAVFNRPPSDTSKGIVVVADNKVIAETAVDYIVGEVLKTAPADKKLNAIIMVGDLGDPNAVGRKDGFYAAINKQKDRFNVIEVATKWDAATGLANLESAVTANPDVDLLFTSSDFLFPTIRSVLEPRGKWKKAGEAGHVVMAGLDGDKSACGLIRDGYVDATGVQDLFFEADAAMKAILSAIEKKEAQPNQVIMDPGFALTRATVGTDSAKMWGCVLADGG